MTDTLFQRALETHRARALGLARKLAGEDAQDLLQDACVRAWDRRATYDDRYPFWPWFARIICTRHVHNIRLSATMKRGPSPLSLSEVTYDAPDAAETPYDTAVASDLLRQVEEALEGMLPKHRDVFLRTLRSQTGPEIASALNITQSNVRCALFYTRRKLQRILTANE